MIELTSDEAYARWREALVPVAEAMADGRCPKPEGARAAELRGWSWRWDAAFHRAMSELTADPFGTREVH